MKILQGSIIPTLSLVSLALLSTAHGNMPTDTAVQQYSWSGNHITNTGVIGSPSANTSYGLRFSGTNSDVSNNNVVQNYGVIYSGSGDNWHENAGIAFDASNGGHSNGNSVTNYGTIIGVGSYAPFGILFNSTDNGETNFNYVLNVGSIQASSDYSNATGIGFLVNNAYKCANSNTIVNTGSITVTTPVDPYSMASGIRFDAQDGVADFNTITN